MTSLHSPGVRQLKAQLSEYLTRVRGGERITITDRGKPIARLVPIDQPDPPGWIDGVVRTGGARWAGGKPAGLAKRLPRRGRPASAMVLEDRR